MLNLDTLAEWGPQLPCNSYCSWPQNDPQCSSYPTVLDCTQRVLTLSGNDVHRVANRRRLPCHGWGTVTWSAQGHHLITIHPPTVCLIALRGLYFILKLLGQRIYSSPIKQCFPVRLFADFIAQLFNYLLKPFFLFFFFLGLHYNQGLHVYFAYQ